MWPTRLLEIVTGVEVSFQRGYCVVINAHVFQLWRLEGYPERHRREYVTERPLQSCGNGPNHVNTAMTAMVKELRYDMYIDVGSMDKGVTGFRDAQLARIRCSGIVSSHKDRLYIRGLLSCGCDAGVARCG